MADITPMEALVIPMRRVSVHEMLFHGMAGAALGLLLALYLLVGNAALFQMITNCPAPRLAVLGLAAFSSSTIAVGSALTGILFTIWEKS